MALAHDTWLIFIRALRQAARNPTWVVVGLSQPLVYLVLFRPMLEPMAATPGFPPGDSWQVMLALLALAGTGYAGFSLIADLRSGVQERLRGAPISPTALLFGQVGKDLVVILGQAALLLSLALAMGLRAAPLGVVVGVALTIPLAVTIAVTSYVLALGLRNEDALSGVLSSIMIPLMLLSGILLPISLAPDWLHAISRANPLAYIVEAQRAAFLGDLGPEVLIGGLVAVGLLLLAGWWGTRAFRREAG
ncbi:ABC transporter permease [Actinoalloteichus hymeniacidonis]|uniref:Transport permease protein n=1 Tax=Actinoalloteichus hymeniacidonis TaxID=340345 RepID=A0AAC9HLL5_9PSEU|nr:ABC transporter permease [Actinoalloteichus hymeniacidonis]AOS61534.1 ABC-2 type transporter [Actinoalloteichus hymeniacidonis]MBB5910458.1 ABC-2 type transport system permease protein [Actinoalloteichus hymeniacidonis]